MAITGTSIADFVSGMQNNPLWIQGKIQANNQPFLNTEALKAYQNQLTGQLPQQQVAAVDPYRMAGLQSQISAGQGAIQNLFGGAASQLGGYGNAAGVGTSALQSFAGGGGAPQFSTGGANDYMNFINPNMLGAQQALANQANLAWNKGVAGLADGGGFMSSGRNAALGQARENAMTNLGMAQQKLAYDAATQAAQLGGQYGSQAATQRLGAAGTLGQQGLSALGLTPAIAQGQLLPGQIQEAAGASLQQQRQNELNAQYQNQLAQFQNPFKALQNYQAGLGVLGSSNYAPNMMSPNNAMALFTLLGGDLSKFMGGVGSGLFGPGGLSGVGGTVGGWLRDLFGNIFRNPGSSGGDSITTDPNYDPSQPDFGD